MNEIMSLIRTHVRNYPYKCKLLTGNVNDAFYCNNSSNENSG